MSARRQSLLLFSAVVVAALLRATAASGPILARELLAPNATSQLSVSSAAFGAGEAIPAPYSQEGENFSPALAWRGAPSATRSFVVILEDPDAADPKPFVHWMLYNIPPTVAELHESIPNLPQLPQLSHARQGRNSRGTLGYVGPRPPHGDAPHHYHFQMFALDAPLALPPGADRDALLAAMKGHTVAAGEVVGTFQRR